MGLKKYQIAANLMVEKPEDVMLSHPICSKIFMVKWSGLQINQFSRILSVNWVSQVNLKENLLLNSLQF